jgi:hypothetical protein
MTVTRDVILDVWPLYEAGEVSADTRALVDGFLAGDPEFARLLRRAEAAASRVLGRGTTPGTSLGTTPSTPSTPMVLAVRRRLARQRRIAALAVFVSLLPLSVGNLGGGSFLVARQFPAIWIALPVAGLLWYWLWRTTKWA